MMKSLLKLFPLRATRYFDNRPVLIRGKKNFAAVTFVVCMFSLLLNLAWRPGSPKALTLVTDAKIVVNPSLTLSQMIDRGRFDVVIIDGFKNQPLGGGSYTAKTRLFPLEYGDLRETNAFIARSGYRPANEDELLAWGLKNPQEQMRYNIVATGKTNRAKSPNCVFPRSILEGYKGKRYFSLVCRSFPTSSYETYVLGVK